MEEQMESAVMDGRRRTTPSLNELTARDEPASVLTRDSVCHRRLTAINSGRVCLCRGADSDARTDGRRRDVNKERQRDKLYHPRCKHGASFRGCQHNTTV